MEGKSLKPRTTSSTWKMSPEDVRALKEMEEESIRYINPYTGAIVKSKEEIFESPGTYHYVCVVCGRTGKVIYCDCISNPNFQSILEGEWKCPSCCYKEREHAKNDTDIEPKKPKPDIVYSRRKRNRNQDA